MRYDRGQEGRACVFDKEGRPLYTTTEAAALLGVEPSTIKNAIKWGVLAYEQVNSRLNRVTSEAIETYRRERLGQRGGDRSRPIRRLRPQRTFLQEGRTNDSGPQRGYA